MFFFEQRPSRVAREKPRFDAIEALAFDHYGTLFDKHAISELIEAQFPARTAGGEVRPFRPLHGLSMDDRGVAEERGGLTVVQKDHQRRALQGLQALRQGL